jgi:flagellar basal-body rod protein FlgC
MFAAKKEHELNPRDRRIRNGRRQPAAGSVGQQHREHLPGANAPNAAGYPAAYAPKRLDQIDVAGGTAARVTTVSPSYVASYDPGAPYADKNGMVAAPNVDLGNEIVQQITARYAFALNAKVMQVDSEMMRALLDIKT